jgi:GT2 family glycosyltransferase
MKTSIVIPCYNTAELLRKNLPLVLKAAGNPQNNILEVIVVDDGSPDTSADVVKKEFPQIRLIKHRVNRGFSAAVNTGVRMAKGDLVCLLNTDVIPADNFLVSVSAHFEQKEIFAVSFHEKDYSWAKGDFKTGYLNHSLGKESSGPHISLWASGGSAVFRRDYWMSLGGMDEKLFSPFYWEDIDLSFRAYKRGLSVLWDPMAQVEHKHESTIGQLSKGYTQRIKERNELLFIWKNITSSHLFGMHIRALFARMLRHPGYIRIVLMAMAKAPLVDRARRKERKEAKVSDETIFARFA